MYSKTNIAQSPNESASILFKNSQRRLQLREKHKSLIINNEFQPFLISQFSTPQSYNQIQSDFSLKNTDIKIKRLEAEISMLNNEAYLKEARILALENQIKMMTQEKAQLLKEINMISNSEMTLQEENNALRAAYIYRDTSQHPVYHQESYRKQESYIELEMRIRDLEQMYKYHVNKNKETGSNRKGIELEDKPDFAAEKYHELKERLDNTEKMIVSSNMSPIYSHISEKNALENSHKRLKRKPIKPSKSKKPSKSRHSSPLKTPKGIKNNK